MKTRIIIDGNAFYEIDEECMKSRKEKEEKKQKSENKEAQRTKKAGR